MTYPGHAHNQTTLLNYSTLMRLGNLGRLGFDAVLSLAPHIAYSSGAIHPVVGSRSIYNSSSSPYVVLTNSSASHSDHLLQA